LFGCLFAAIVRDTRGVDLSDKDRFNYFPASPLFSVTYVISGEIRLVSPRGGVKEAQAEPPMSQLTVAPPQLGPTVSWSVGRVFAVSLGVYPDAWQKLMERYDISSRLELAFMDGADITDCWTQFCMALLPCWQSVRGSSALSEMARLPQISDWSRALITRVALAGPGRSVRALERRLKRWSGQSKQSLAFYAAIEDLHRSVIQLKSSPLASLAVERGYSDQSHMGRAVRRATGFSPGQLNHLIDTEEAFWCYRLLGERL
jgi:AraC-like DNA-binding protein